MDYDAVARAYGAQVATSDGGGELTALVDAVTLVRGGTVPAARGNIEFSYSARCYSATGQLCRCGLPYGEGLGPPTANADVVAIWGTDDRFHIMQWHIRGVSNDALLVTATGWGSDDRTKAGTRYFMTTTAATLAVIPGTDVPITVDVRAGAQDTTIEIDQGDSLVTVEATASFEEPKVIYLHLDDQLYYLDRKTSLVSSVDPRGGQLY